MGLSRNKVAVPEGAAGSPPFYGDYEILCAVCVGVVPAGPAGWPDGVGVLAWNGLEAVAWMRCWVPGPPPLLVVFPSPVGSRVGCCPVSGVVGALVV